MIGSNSKYCLTEDLVALVERKEPDPGPEPGTKELSDDDFSKLADEVLKVYSPKELWLFAYGSLIWNPEFEYSIAIDAMDADFRNCKFVIVCIDHVFNLH